MKAGSKRCEKQCRGVIVNKARGIYCDHIERKMPKMSKQSIKAVMSEHIHRYDKGMWPLKTERTLKELLGALAKHGLDINEIRLVYYRGVKNKLFKDLARKLRITSERQASRYYHQAIEKLRRRGFKF